MTIASLHPPYDFVILHTYRNTASVIGKGQHIRERLVKAFGLAIILGVVATAAPAGALEVTGASGFLGEWEVTATVTETTSGRVRDYRGPLVMKHIGLCTQDGPVEKKGEMRLQISASSQLNATLSMPGTECTASGPLSDGYNGTMTCSDRQVIPLRLRVK